MDSSAERLMGTATFFSEFSSSAVAASPLLAEVRELLEGVAVNAGNAERRVVSEGPEEGGDRGGLG